MNTLASDLVGLGARWLNELEIRPSTQRAYKFEIHRLARWANGLPCTRLSALPEHFLSEFLDLLAATEQECFARAGLTHPARDSSLLQAKRILSALFEWASASGYVPAAVGYASRRWRIPRGRIVSTASTPPPRQKPRAKTAGFTRARNQLIVALARWAGARPQDISNLRRSDVELRGSVLRVFLPDGKNAPVSTYLPAVAAKAWKDVLKQQPSGEYAISHTATGERLTPSRIARIIAETGSASWNARSLRDEGIRHFQKAGWPDDSIRSQLRRQSLRLSLKAEPEAARLTRVRRLVGPLVKEHENSYA